MTTAMASGWMRIRGIRRRRVIDRGFVLSDHVDWPGLLQSIQATKAENVWVTHGFASQVVRHLQASGISAQAIATRFRGELDEVAADGDDAETDSSLPLFDAPERGPDSSPEIE